MCAPRGDPHAACCVWAENTRVRRAECAACAPHALRGWPVPLGVAINSAVVKFKDGECSEPAISKQIEIMAGQVVDFAKMQIAAQG